MSISTHMTIFLIMVMWTVFFPSMRVYLHSQSLMSTFRYLLWSSCSIQSLVVPTGRMVFLLIKSATVCGSWISSQPLKEFAQQQVKNCANFVFSEDLPQYFLWMLCCLSIFQTISDMFFKADIFTNYFFERQVSCANPTLSVSAVAAVPIGYRIWVLKCQCCGT